MSDPIRVRGLRELNQAFARADPLLKKELDKGLREAGEPVRATAEGYALSRIRNATLPWSRMRTGSTQKLVYVAPRKRGTRGRGPRSRPNYAELLLGHAMQPALDVNELRTLTRLEKVLDTVGKDWERG